MNGFPALKRWAIFGGRRAADAEEALLRSSFTALCMDTVMKRRGVQKQARLSERSFGRSAA